MAKIGIDFGTSYTTASYVRETGDAVAIKIDGKEKIPTILYFDKVGNVLVGERAYNKFQECIDAENDEQLTEILSGIIVGMKRNMSEDEAIALPSGNSISYTEAISIFIKYIKEYVEKHVFEGETVTDVCLTYPIVFDETPYKKDILKNAADMAGFTNIRLLKEPVAAAIGYSRNRNIKNQGILIYDFGGGTFDLAYVKFDHNGEHITLPPIGDGDCGGENIDYNLYKLWDNQVYSLNGRHISQYEAEVYLPILKYECQKGKEEMSKGIFQNKRLYLPPSSDMVRLNKLSNDDFDNIVSPVVDKTISLTKQMLQRIEDEKFTIDKVILIGGSSKLLMVEQKLKEVLPILPTPVPDVDVAVANGAAIYICQNEIVETTCYCIYNGCKITTAHRNCMYCGKPNYRYNYAFDDV